MSRSAEQQQQIKDYCCNHKLTKPEINRQRLIAIATTYIVLSAVFVALSVLLTGHLHIWAVDVSIGLPLLVYGNRIGIIFIEIYQHYAPEHIRRQCSCKPTCSEYAILAFKKYYWIKALYLTCRRVFITCAQPGYHLDYP